MARIVYVNGQYRPYAKALIHAEDRGFQFADAIYEVIEVLGGKLVDATRHLVRLERSLSEIKIAPPMGRAALLHVIGEVIRRNRVRHGVVYLQVSRGEGRRDFALPDAAVAPTLVILARSQPPTKMAAQAEAGIAVKTMPDIRWGRSDIKTVMLLPACLAKDAAKHEGAKEAWFVDAAGHITEGASSNAWIVTDAGVLVTRQLDHRILGGVTRATALDVAAKAQIKVEERAFTRTEALAAREAFVTSATNTVMPVVAIDGQIIGTGKPGPVALRLRSEFHQTAEISAS
ncbi:MAG: D-amino-acid transaminase [Hyphomicrobium sp.]|nr:D-amino-acid transaminase [Hyphomicrobium sp.]